VVDPLRTTKSETDKPENDETIRAAVEREFCRRIVEEGNEPEQGTNLPISSVGTESNIVREGQLPRGAALLTSAGRLGSRFSADINLKGIIHACPESFTVCGNDENTFLGGVALAVKNSIILARKNGYHRVAVPFIGSAIFGGDSNREKLAQVVVYSAIRQGLTEGVEISFIS